MIRKSQQFIVKILYIFIDVVCLYSAIYLSCLIRKKLVDFPLSFPYFLVDASNPFRFIFSFWILTTVLFLNFNNLYQTRREVPERIEIWLVIKSVFFSSLVTIAAIYASKVYGFPRTVFMNTTLAMMILLSLWRVLKREFVEYLVSRGYNNFNALIVGAGKVGMALAQEIKKRPGLGIKVVGFLDDAKTADPGQPEIKILGKISNFPEIVRREFVNKIFITIHHDSNVFLRLLEQAREMGVAVRVIPHGFDLTTGEFFKYNIGFIPILEYAEEQDFRRHFGKRFFDFMISLLSFVILLPLLVAIGLILKIDSRGPILYKSKRYGCNGRMFNMYKFRSMTKDADKMIDQLRHQNEVDGPIFKIRGDPRITRVGAFLRRYSLDELPQLINVLRGDMSLVGPRPLPVDQIHKEDLRQLKRLEVRPGITGLWQIRGRSDISFARLVKWDIWYINNWSFWLDLNILFQTIPVVWKGKGAY
jgi:exopolysaccharide biosynthesis polyprenyl glycosylphosphotransferase